MSLVLFKGGSPGPRGKAVTPENILEAFRTQVRVINALILRETRTRYGNTKIGFLWALIEPLVGVSVFVTIFANLRHDNPSGMPLVAFMIVGFVCYGYFRDPWSRMQTGISTSRHLLTFPQVTSFDVILSRGLLDIVVNTMVLGLMLYMAWLAGFEVRCERPLGVILVCGLLGMTGIGLGFLLASIEPMLPSIKQFSNQVLGRPMYFGSGLFYTAETLPPAVRDVLLYNPVLNMIELLRGEFFHEFETNHGSWSYAAVWAVGLLTLGLLAHQALHKKAIVSK